MLDFPILTPIGYKLFITLFKEKTIYVVTWYLSKFKDFGEKFQNTFKIL